MFTIIKKELERRKLPVAWLAAKLGESEQNVNHWKSRGVPAVKVKKVAEIMNIPREVLEGDESYREEEAIDTANMSVKWKIHERIDELYEGEADTMLSVIEGLIASRQTK